MVELARGRPEAIAEWSASFATEAVSASTIEACSPYFIRLPSLHCAFPQIVTVVVATTIAQLAASSLPAGSTEVSPATLYGKLVALRFDHQLRLPGGLSQSGEVTPLKLTAHQRHQGIVGIVALPAGGDHGVLDVALDIAVFQNPSDASADPWFVNSIEKEGTIHEQRGIRGLPPPVRTQVGQTALPYLKSPPSDYVRLGFVYRNVSVVAIALRPTNTSTTDLTAAAATLDRYGLWLIRHLGDP